jgi:hypothetical protein
MKGSGQHSSNGTALLEMGGNKHDVLRNDKAFTLSISAVGPLMIIVVLWAFLRKCIYSQGASAFLAGKSVAGLGSQMVKVSPI